MKTYDIFNNLKKIIIWTENLEELTIDAEDVTYTNIHDYNDEDRGLYEVNRYEPSKDFQHLTIKIKSDTKCFWKQYEERNDFDAVKRFEKFKDITSVKIVYQDNNEKEIPIYWSSENPEFARLDHDLYQKHYYEVEDGKLTGNYCLEFVVKLGESA